MKKSVGSNTYLLPLPTVVVSTFDQKGKANMMVASWTGVVNSSPAMISVSLRKATYTHDLIIDRKAFTISIPSQEHILEMDYVGTVSGRQVDKFKRTGLTPLTSSLVDAPYVDEFPITLECELVNYEPLGLHTIFIAEVKDIKIEESYLTGNGMPDVNEIDPIAYVHGERTYYEVGRYLGKANRLWQVSHLNDSIEPDQKEILQLIHRYYHSIDESQPIEAIYDLINWQVFEMVNGGLIIDSFEKYEAWYNDVLKNMFNRKHVIEKLVFEENENGTFKVHMEMNFTANSWIQGEARSKSIKVQGKIEWILRRDTESKEFKLEKYLIDA